MNLRLLHTSAGCRPVLFRAFTLMIAMLVGAASQASPPPMEADGTVHVPAFDLPVSAFLSAATRTALQRPERMDTAYAVAGKGVSRPTVNDRAKWSDFRRRFAEAFWETPLYQQLRAEFAVVATEKQIGGITTEVFVPTEGIAPENQGRVLINLHGGGFGAGWHVDSYLESIPIAALGRIKVISVDYRLGPEDSFPAASEDVAAVYRELLKEYRPENIGIFGSSAGGTLTAQSMAWFMREGLPLPAAVGMFFGAGSYWFEGDSGHLGASLLGYPTLANLAPWETGTAPFAYFSGTLLTDPLVFPVRSDSTLKRFPASLLISASRDQCLSSVVHMHSRLVANGVEAQLNVWEGLGHCFTNEAVLPESREAYAVVVKFFAEHLGKPAPAAAMADAKGLLAKALASEVERFVSADRVSPPAPHQVLFVGSSSIVKWSTLAADFAPLPVLNRGFGGSEVEYVNRWFDQVVRPYQPRAIVFYAGENDLASGKSAAQVLADFDTFMAKKTEALGQIPVYFISLKPSKLRFWQFKQQSEVNAAVQAQAKHRKDLHYIDVVTPMLKDGRPRDLFVADGLHMTPEGYSIWTQEVKAALGAENSIETK